MKTNGLRAIWGKGKVVINGWLGVPSAFSAEIFSQSGCDSLCIDLQHGVIDYQIAVSMLQAINTTEVVPLVRVPWNEPSIIMKCLDAGAWGIVCPMVNTRDDSERFVKAARYPPNGFRSFGPVRVQLSAGEKYFDIADEGILTFALIETAEALKNLSEIIQTPGLDALYVGAADLGISMGYKPSLDPVEPEIIAAVDKIVVEGRAHGLHVGGHAVSAMHAKQLIKRGFDMITAFSDTRLLLQTSSQIVTQTRD